MTALVEDSLRLEISNTQLDEVGSSSKARNPQGPTKPGKPVSSEGDLRCGICNKSYSRRDLRDRHQRRCIKKAGQERQSRRKSCETCAQKKLRCSMTRPVCSRCSQMGISCHYPPFSIPPRVPVSQGRQNLPVPSIPPSSTAIASSATSSGSLPPYSESMVTDKSTWDVPNSVQAELSRTGTTDTQQPASPSQQQSGTLDPFNLLPSVSWNPFTSNMDFGRELDDSFLLQSQDAPAFQWNDDFTFSTDSLNTERAPAAFTHPAAPPSPSIPPSISPDGLQRHNVTHADDTDPSYMEAIRNDNPPRLTFAHDFTPKLGPLAPREASNMYEDLFAALREYPGLILEREFWSPFVHHQFYRCSLEGMAEPLGVALACVSAYASSSSVQTSYAFVDRMINEEREKLVRNFQAYMDTPETCLAALHAVCVYQILGLFGDDFTPAPIIKPTSSKETGYQRRKESERTAELHSSFLLKMTRRLCNVQDETLYIHHQDETNWTRWRFTESLRRNVFFVNIINILGAKAQKFSEDYYEPLDDDMILVLPLPAPENMWRAPSEEEWLDARERSMNSASSIGETGSGQTVPVARTLRELLDRERVRTLDVQSLLPVTRMILACAKIRSNGSTSSSQL